MSPHTRLLLLLLCATCSIAQQPPVSQTQGWWMTEPSRWVQTNLRQTDASLDAKHLVGQLADMRANVLLFGMGGIAAYYPTKVAFHYASPDLAPAATCSAKSSAKLISEASALSAASISARPPKPFTTPIPNGSFEKPTETR